jgi:hypothetical protein
MLISASMQTLHVFSSSSASSSAAFSLVAALEEEDDVAVVEVEEVEVDGTGASDLCFAVPPETSGAGFLPPA